MSLLLTLPPEILRLISSRISDSIYDFRLTCRALSRQKVLHRRRYFANSKTPAAIIATRTDITLSISCARLVNMLCLKHVRSLTLVGFVELSRENFPELQCLNITDMTTDMSKIPNWINNVSLSGEFKDITCDIPLNISTLRIRNPVMFDPKSNNLSGLVFFAEPTYCKIPASVRRLRLMYRPSEIGRVHISHKLESINVVKPLSSYFRDEVIPTITDFKAWNIGTTYITSADKFIGIKTQEPELDVSTLDLPADTKSISILWAPRDSSTGTVFNIPDVKRLNLINCITKNIPIVSKLLVSSFKLLSSMECKNIINLKLTYTHEYKFDFSRLYNLEKLEMTSHLLVPINGEPQLEITLPPTLKKLTISEHALADATGCINKAVFTGSELAAMLAVSNMYDVFIMDRYFKLKPKYPDVHIINPE